MTRGILRLMQNQSALFAPSALHFKLIFCFVLAKLEHSLVLSTQPVLFSALCTSTHTHVNGLEFRYRDEIMKKNIWFQNAMTETHKQNGQN